MGSERPGTTPAIGPASRPPGAHSRLALDRGCLCSRCSPDCRASSLSLVWLWTGDHGSRCSGRSRSLVRRRVARLRVAIARERVMRPLQTLSNLLAALREGDYSVRGARRDEHDALGLAMTRSTRSATRCARSGSARSRRPRSCARVMEEIDVAVFAFDDDATLRLVNRAGERLLGQPVERLLGRDAAALGLERAICATTRRARSSAFPGRHAARWEVAATRVPPGRPAAPAARADRRQPRAARGGAPGLAAPGARARPRDQQLARADQVDRARACAALLRASRARPTATRISRAGSSVIDGARRR